MHLHRGHIGGCAALLLLVGGCGGDHRSGAGASREAPRSTSTAANTATVARRSITRAQPSVTGGPAPLLVLFKRVVGFDPLSSQLLVDRDGDATATITLGGINGQKKEIFTLPRSQLRRLRDLLARTHLHDTRCCFNPGYYTYWVTTDGHSWQLAQLGLPRSMRPLVDDMNAIMAAHTAFS